MRLIGLLMYAQIEAHQVPARCDADNPPTQE